MPNRVTLQDVADRAGTSRTTAHYARAASAPIIRPPTARGDPPEHPIRSLALALALAPAQQPCDHGVIAGLFNRSMFGSGRQSWLS